MSSAEKKTTLEVHVHPSARANEVAGFREGILQAKVTAPATKGQANRALLELMAEALEVPKQNLLLIRGHTHRHKVIGINGLSQEELNKRLTRVLPEKELSP